jgi:myo-inositol-1(or 4)-monophosphatase
MSTAALLPTARDAVALASRLVRTRLPGVVQDKSERDLVTEVDVLVERTLREFLRERTPQIGFLGEEEGLHGASDGGLRWALDPIDGTSNFVHGLPLCAVSLGLVDTGRAVLGVIDLPFLGTTYHAADGEGAFCGRTRLRASSRDNIRDAIVAIGDYAVGDEAQRRNQVRLSLTRLLADNVHRVRMLGSAAIDLAWVAEGRLDGSVMLSNKPWDTSAGVVIAREAGAVVCDLDGSPHTTNSTATIAVGSALADDILTLVGKAIASAETG